MVPCQEERLGLEMRVEEVSSREAEAREAVSSLRDELAMQRALAQRHMAQVGRATRALRCKVFYPTNLVCLPLATGQASCKSASREL